MIANDLSATIAVSTIGVAPTKKFGVLMHYGKSCARQAAQGHTTIARKKASYLRVHTDPDLVMLVAAGDHRLARGRPSRNDSTH
jgi:hypothetical protein